MLLTMESDYAIVSLLVERQDPIVIMCVFIGLLLRSYGIDGQFGNLNRDKQVSHIAFLFSIIWFLETKTLL